VVDNASKDGSADMVDSQFPGVNLIKNDTNIGFAAAVNQAYGLSSGRYVLLLNPDTLVLAGAINTLFSYMESHPDVGAAGPRQWLNLEKSLQSSVIAKPPDIATMLARVPFVKRFTQKTLTDKFWIKDFNVWISNSPLPVDALNGSCVLVRRATIEEVGVLDENFFLFFEDVDWCVRMRRKGWELYCVPGAEIVHFVMRSVVRTEGISEISQKSLSYYIKKHMRPWGYMLWNVLKMRSLLRPVKHLLQKIKDLGPSRKPERIERVRNSSGDESTLHWDADEDASAYLIEISDDPLFLYKAGAICESNRFVLSPALRESNPEGIFMWRVAPIYEKKRLGVFTAPKFLSLEKEKTEDP
jgi:GT2 family glycosyltransferase